MNQQHHSAGDTVRKLSKGGVYLGKIRADIAREMLRAGTATIAASTRKSIKAIYVKQGVEASIPGAVALTYDEDLGARHIVTLKRHNPADGGFHRWDPNLTFRELRLGRYESEATVIARRERMLQRSQRSMI